VDTPTTLIAALEFENGVLGTFHISSDSSMSQNFVITGTQGVFKLGDPNMFNAELQVTRPGAQPPVGYLTPGMQPKGMESDAEEEDDDIQKLAERVPGDTVSLPLLHGYSDSSRGIGLADMCYAIRNGRRPRCHADIGYHAIEVIHGIQESCKTGRIYEMTTRCERPKLIRTSAYSASCQEATLDD